MNPIVLSKVFVGASVFLDSALIIIIFAVVSAILIVISEVYRAKRHHNEILQRRGVQVPKDRY